MTTARARFLTAAHGGEVDRPPVGGWIHHGSSFWTPWEVAEAHLRFVRAYDWDCIKVMDDFRLDLPEGLEEITDVAQFETVSPDPQVVPGNLVKQAEVLRLLRAAEPDRAIIDTIFSPTQTLVRALGESIIDHFRADPALAHRTVSRVATQLSNYAALLADLGVDGVFLAVNGASQDATSWGLSPEEFRDWIAPYDRQVFEAAESLVRIAHLHGQGADPELIRDYPVEVLSWSDRDSAPEISRALPDYGWVPMLGLDEVHSLYWTGSQATEQVLAARRASGDRLIIAPNCTLHSDGSPKVLSALRAAAELPLD